MDTNASLGRFYPFTANTSATLPSPAHPQNPQIRPGGSGSESPSDDDGSGSQGSYPLGHSHSAVGVSRQPYEVQHPSSFLPPRLESAPATVYVDDSPYVPPGLSNTARAPTFVQSGPDVPFDPAIQHYDAIVCQLYVPGHRSEEDMHTDEDTGVKMARSQCDWMSHKGDLLPEDRVVAVYIYDVEIYRLVDRADLDVDPRSVVDSCMAALGAKL